MQHCSATWWVKRDRVSINSAVSSKCWDRCPAADVFLLYRDIYREFSYLFIKVIVIPRNFAITILF